MTDEMKLAVNINISSGFYVCAINKSWNVDLTTLGEGGGIQVIGLSEEALDFDEVSPLGYLYLVNLDTTNKVTFGPDSGGNMVAFGDLYAGEAALIRLVPGITVKAQATTAAVRLFVKAWDGGT